jgi:hypothetical protein
MEGFNAVTGFRNEDARLFEEKLRFIVGQVDPEAQESRFERVASIAGLPGVEQVLSQGRTVNVANLLEIREDSSCQDLRAWLRNVDSETDDEISTAFEDVRSKLAYVLDSKQGRVMRFLITTGSAYVPLAGPIISPALSAADTFLLEKIIGRPGPATFLNREYRGLFE